MACEYRERCAAYDGRYAECADGLPGECKLYNRFILEEAKPETLTPANQDHLSPQALESLLNQCDRLIAQRKSRISNR